MNNLNEVISLIQKEYVQDDYGVMHEQEKASEVFAFVKSAGQSEWFEGGRNGLNPTHTFLIKQIDYDGEDTVLYKGTKFAVYRTYVVDETMIELHVQKEKGA